MGGHGHGITCGPQDQAPTWVTALPQDAPASQGPRGTRHCFPTGRPAAGVPGSQHAPVQVLGARPHPQLPVDLLVDLGPAALQAAVLRICQEVTALPRGHRLRGPGQQGHGRGGCGWDWGPGKNLGLSGVALGLSSPAWSSHREMANYSPHILLHF